LTEKKFAVPTHTATYKKKLIWVSDIRHIFVFLLCLFPELYHIILRAKRCKSRSRDNYKNQTESLLISRVTFCRSLLQRHRASD